MQSSNISGCFNTICDLQLMSHLSNKQVDVLMITYNHEQYVEKAIQGVLDQKADFRIRLIIGEDCSKDDTLRICEEFVKRYPDKIELITSNTNVGVIKNFQRIYSRCEGEYIAICEGDDYWKDPNKLQMQIDLLESDSTLVAVYHQVDVLHQNTQEVSPGKVLKNQRFDDFDMLNNVIPTLSMVFRNCLGPLSLQDLGVLHIDKFLWNLLAMKGSFYRLEKVMAVYREHDQGVWSGADEKKQINNKIISRWHILGFATDVKHRKVLLQQIVNYSRSGLGRSIKRDKSIIWTYKFGKNWLGARWKQLFAN